MKSRVLLLALLIATSGLATERWWSPDKFYSLIPPAGWKPSADKGATSSSYSFTSPDGKAEVRFSAAYHLSLPECLPDDVLDLGFPKERGITPINRIRGAAWDGLRREYTDAAESTRWVGLAARRGSTVVLLTMKGPATEFERLRPIFDAVSQSLTLGK